MNSSTIKLPELCLLFATELEANSFVEKLNINFSSDKYKYGLHEKFSLVIAGMGKVNAACATMWVIDCGAKKIINAGIAGALNESLELFSLYKPGLVKDLDLLNFTIPQLKTGESSITLGTVGSPLKGGSLKNQLVDQADLIDMEGFAIAKVSEQLGVSCTFIKVVSDYCMNNSSDEIIKNLPKLSEKLADELILFLNL
ncbi:MAG: hypothetical protein COA79_18680 [Planctomycetota bacterium]|nr:MAG: hypothetical protein COA79_18680 [Planctomycetota bacterium]